METGGPQIVSYCAVDDCGDRRRPVARRRGAGAGQVLGEQIVYDRKSGQPLTASFMDYIMSRAGLLRELRGEEHHHQQGGSGRCQGHGRFRLRRVDTLTRRFGARRTAPARCAASGHAADAVDTLGMR